MFNPKMIYNLICILGISFISANATITGRISDANSNEPLIGVNIVLLETTRKVDLENIGKTITVKTATNYGASTDIEGDFILKNIPIGEYTIKAMYIGYKNKETLISIEEEKNYTFDLSLDVSEIALEEARVVGTYQREEKKTDAPAKIETVTSKDIEQASTSNLGGYLQGLKGVDFTSSGVNNYSLAIRGFNSSFSTRLLMLTDGRPANVPSLRVVNFSTVPVTQDDVERIEVVLGPATALYGANAHSGVINIITKAPSLSEGFSYTFAGSFDDRNIRKINTRYAKKLNDKMSMKISGAFFSATEWPFISESEYKSHRNPWVGFSGRKIDGKDNNASKEEFIGGLTPARSRKLRWVPTNNKGIYIPERDRYYSTQNGWQEEEQGENLYYIMLGDGEPNHGDLDGDGVAGEDWFNGHDDDGDGLIDEDYWTADGIDNEEPWTNNCIEGETYNGYACTDGFDFIDENGNGTHEGPEPFFDLNGNGAWDFDTDLNANGKCERHLGDVCEWWQDTTPDSVYSYGEVAIDTWDDWDSDKSWDTFNGEIDEFIDTEEDEWLDGVDNNQNGIIDEGNERYTFNQLPSQWANAIEEYEILSAGGRINKYYMDGTPNPWYLEDSWCCDGIDNDWDGLIDIEDPDEKMDTDIRGKSRFNEETWVMEFDVYNWDFGEDGTPGDYYYDHHGDGLFQRGEPGSGSGNLVSGFLDYGLDGFQYSEEIDCADDSGCGDGHQAFNTYIDQFGNVQTVNLFDINGDPIWVYGPDEGEGDGIFQPGDSWNDNNGNWNPDTFNNDELWMGEHGWTLTDNFELIQHIVGEDDNNNGWIDECLVGTWNPLSQEWEAGGFGTTWQDINEDNIPDNCMGLCEGINAQYANCENDPSLYISFEYNTDTSVWGYYETLDIEYPTIEPSIGESYDLWPPANLSYGPEDIIKDCGQDGYCWDFSPDANPDYQTAKDIWGQPLMDSNGNPIIIYGPDYGENDGINPLDSGDFDNIYDTSDGEWNAEPEPFEDINNNGIWDQGEPFTDSDNNGYYTNGDWNAQLDLVRDTNGDGIDDYPDFEVKNNKVEFRFDYDPNPDLNLTFQTGYAYTKTQQVTGVGRYLADGWQSQYYQLRGRYKNWFAQAFYNDNDAGQTRGYNRGDVITDQSSNYGIQLQYAFDIPKISTEIIVGFDYMLTDPFTNGSVLNDGPNGFDDDEDSESYAWDNIDQDGDGDIEGDYDEVAWGIDEDDEFESNLLSEELGFYFQTKTDLFNNRKWELITSARLDYHDQLKEEGLLFAPKMGLTYSPSDFTTWRMSYGKAYNTPTITALHTNLIFGKWGEFYTMILKGNKDGSPYARADYKNEYGEYGYNINLIDPFYYKEDVDGTLTKIEFASGNLNACTEYANNPCDPYQDRVQGAPLFYNTGDGNYPNDFIPLDTLNHVVFIPSAYDEGVEYSPTESAQLSDIDPLRSESMQTLEFGFKSFLTRKALLSADIYFTKYNDFFSPATFITPLVRERGGTGVIGMIPTNLDGTNPDYGTAWDGRDNDNDFSGMGYYIPKENIQCLDENGMPTNAIYPCGFIQESQTHLMDYDDLENYYTVGQLTDWADEFGWYDDKDGNCVDESDPLYNDPNFATICLQDPGEWGYVDRLDFHDENQNGTYDEDEYYIYTIVTPDEIWGMVPDVEQEGITSPTYQGQFITYDNVDTRWIDVGVDEYNTRIGGHYEAEWLDEETGRIGLPNKLPIITLSSLNYGEVYHSGLDLGFTYFFSQSLIMDFNFTLFNSTDYYNELTKRYDPINSPKFKFNIAANYNTNKFGSILMKWRHVDEYEWADGTWSGTIGPYNIIDLHYNYDISDNLKFGISGTNIFNDMQRELVGGAKMGRTVIMRLTTIF